MQTDLSLVFLGLMVFLAHLFVGIYKRRMVPDVLLLIIIGLLMGPVFGIITPDSLGSFGPVFVSVTLVVILFEGGTTLSLSTMKSAWQSTMLLTMTAFIVSVVLIGAIAFFFLGFSLNSAIMLGAILGGTSSAVVIPMVKQLSMGEETRTALILESAITDVLCIVTTLACLEVFQQGNLDIGRMVGGVLSSFILAAVLGVIAALVWSRVLTRVRTIQNSIFTTPAFVFVVFGTTQLLGFSGAIAALAFGITMANLDNFKGYLIRKIMGGEGHKLNDTELVFLRELTFLLKTFFFVYIGLSIIFEDSHSFINGIIITFVLLLARLIVAKYCAPTTANDFDKTVVAVMVPKGLAAAVLATIPYQMGVPEGLWIKNIVYACVLFTITATSILILTNRSGALTRIYSRYFHGSLFNKKLK